jgi:hypothetical protein
MTKSIDASENGDELPGVQPESMAAPTLAKNCAAGDATLSLFVRIVGTPEAETEAVGGFETEAGGAEVEVETDSIGVGAGAAAETADTVRDSDAVDPALVDLWETLRGTGIHASSLLGADREGGVCAPLVVPPATCLELEVATAGLADVETVDATEPEPVTVADTSVPCDGVPLLPTGLKAALAG